MLGGGCEGAWQLPGRISVMPAGHSPLASVGVPPRPGPWPASSAPPAAIVRNRVTTKGSFDIVPDIICGSVLTPATRRAAGLPAGGLLALGLGLALAGPAGAQQQPPVDLAARFAQRVDAYEAADTTSPPPIGAILLAGDSQFDRWKTFTD